MIQGLNVLWVEGTGRGNNTVKVKDNARGFGRTDNDAGWRVRYQELSIPMCFLRERDALCAMDSIKDMIEWTGTPEEVVSKLEKLGLCELRQKMTERLFW